MGYPRRPSLTRELALVLAVKVALIIAIKLVFFSDPLRPGDGDVAQALLSANAPATAEGTAHHE